MATKARLNVQSRERQTPGNKLICQTRSYASSSSSSPGLQRRLAAWLLVWAGANREDEEGYEGWTRGREETLIWQLHLLTVGSDFLDAFVGFIVFHHVFLQVYLQRRSALTFIQDICVWMWECKRKGLVIGLYMSQPCNESACCLLKLLEQQQSCTLRVPVCLISRCHFSSCSPVNHLSRSPRCNQLNLVIWAENATQRRFSQLQKQDMAI